MDGRYLWGLSAISWLIALALAPICADAALIAAFALTVCGFVTAALALRRWARRDSDWLGSTLLAVSGATGLALVVFFAVALIAVARCF